MTDSPTKKIEDAEALQLAKTKILAYPLDIGSQNESKYTIFNIYEYKKTDVNKAEFKTALGSIVLPIPPELNNSDSLNYKEYSAPLLNALFEFGASDTLGDAATALGGAGSVLGSQVLNAGFRVNKMNISGENLVNQVSALAGVSINPKNTNIFVSPSAREHKYAFKMVAKSEEESKAIRQIINKFRYHSYPDAVSNDEIIYKSPDLFTISFKVGRESSDDKDSYLFHPLPSALVAMSVSYNGTSSPVFFQSTNAPVEVTLQLVFKEMELDNKAKLLERYNIHGTTPSTGGGGTFRGSSGTFRGSSGTTSDSGNTGGASGGF